MKRFGKLVLSSAMVFVLAATLAGCGQDDGNAVKNGTGVYSTSKTVNDVLSEQAGTTVSSSEDTAASDNEETSTEEVAATENKETTEAPVDVSAVTVNKGDDVDVDLTTLSSTMVYSEVYNMVTDPSTYMGKTVRMEGTLAIYHDDTDNNDYYACVVKDATACCAQGIEFVLKDGNYPEANTDVQVVGVFSSYKIEDYEYFTLVNAVME